MPKFNFLNLTILVIITLSISYLAYATLTPFSPNKKMYYGVVDPSNEFKNKTNIDIEHHFTVWSDGYNTDFANKLEDALSKKRIPMITIEPWALDSKKAWDYKDLVGERYGKVITDICQIVDNKKKKVIIRWGHEMEQPSQRYPWANGDSAGFIKAYQFFVDTCRSATPFVEFMWSPAGKANMDLFYPGSRYVDLIGLSTFGNPEFEVKTLGKAYSFEDHFNERYNRTTKYQKDVYLAEFGVAGDDSYKAKWLKQAKLSILNPLRYPNLKGIVYFQFSDPKPWVEGTSAPDFRITPNIFPMN